LIRDSSNKKEHLGWEIFEDYNNNNNNLVLALRHKIDQFDLFYILSLTIVHNSRSENYKYIKQHLISQKNVSRSLLACPLNMFVTQRKLTKKTGWK